MCEKEKFFAANLADLDTMLMSSSTDGNSGRIKMA